MSMEKSKMTIERWLMDLFYGPRYQPLSGKIQSEIEIVSFQKLSIFTLALPFLGFLFCLIWSCLFDFAASTATHCGAKNYLPSISSSIGSSPQRYVWRTAIGLHSSPRLLVAYLYYKKFHKSWFLLAANWLEISALLGLSMVSSTECFPFHAVCFVTFISASFIGMWKHLLDENLWSNVKLRLFCINTVAWILAIYFYERHNIHCEKGVYTLFALAEYTFVFTNMFFNFQAYHDFSTLSVFCGIPRIHDQKFSV